ncbi:MAG: hypothetical protein NVV83_21400 [Afipia sp.]|nr:hypothetical protein [Afipia sp.]
MRVTADLAEIALACEHPSGLEEIVGDIVLQLQPDEEQKEECDHSVLSLRGGNPQWPAPVSATMLARAAD